MKVAICSQGSTLDSPIDSRFARAPYFFIYDTESGDSEFMENPNLGTAHGAGIQAAQLLSSEGIDAVCARRVGLNAFTALGACGLKIYSIDEESTVEKVVELLKDGSLKEHTKATNPGHPRF